MRLQHLVPIGRIESAALSAHVCRVLWTKVTLAELATLHHRCRLSPGPEIVHDTKTTPEKVWTPRRAFQGDKVDARAVQPRRPRPALRSQMLVRLHVSTNPPGRGREEMDAALKTMQMAARATDSPIVAHQATRGRTLGITTVMFTTTTAALFRLLMRIASATRMLLSKSWNP